MKNCIIHIGMHKTGSTSIQNSLQNFNDDNFLYADLGEPNHSIAIYTLFAANPENHHIHRARRQNVAAMQEYIRPIQTKLEFALKEAKEKTLIISGEDIGALSSEGLVKLRQYFQDRDYKLSIVGYVRSPAGYQASSFQERVKHGVVKQINLEALYPNYEKKFSKFDEVFGRENVHLWKFDAKLFPNGCVVQDFCARLGINLPHERICRKNESLSRQAVSLLYIYQKFGQLAGGKAMSAPEAQILGNALAEIGTDKFRFSPDIVRPCLEKNQTDIEWMEQRLGQSLCEELGEHQFGDIRDESDLLNVDPLVLSKLYVLLGNNAPSDISSGTQEQAVQLVLALREAYRAVSENIKVREILAQIQQKEPSLLTEISDDKAVKLIQSLFLHMHDNLTETQEGVMEYPGLGQFQINQILKKIDEKAILRKQIGFRLAKNNTRIQLSEYMVDKILQLRMGDERNIDSISDSSQLNNEVNNTYTQSYSKQVIRFVKKFL